MGFENFENKTDLIQIDEDEKNLGMESAIDLGDHIKVEAGVCDSGDLVAFMVKITRKYNKPVKAIFQNEEITIKSKG